MSHFTVLVIGPYFERYLQPFHEFECTGTADEYVQSISELDEARAGYESDTTRRFKAPDGALHDRHDDQFYRDPTPEEVEKIGRPAGTGTTEGIFYSSRDWGDGKGYRPKVHFLPEGWEEVDVPEKELRTFREYCEYHHERPVIGEGVEPDLQEEHKWGFIRVNAAGEVIELVRRTNPNCKWDWYLVGGRWSGLLKLKPGASGGTGRPGVMGSHFAKGEDRADQARKGDIDWEGMRAQAEAEAAALYDKVYAVVGAHFDTFQPWPTVREQHTGNIDAARAAYREQPAVKALNECEDRDVACVDLEDYACTREQHLQRARNRAGVTFAVLKDGQWFERGSMGWWGCVSNEKDADEWGREFHALIDSLPDETELTVVDCHI